MELMSKLNNIVYSVRKMDKDVARRSGGEISCDYYLNAEKDRYELPSKIYGTYVKKAQHIFSYYLLSNGSMGCLFHGAPGAGKTLMAEILCNIGIDHGMPVISCYGLDDDSELISFLNTIKNSIIYIDEFGKMVPRYRQDLLLTALSDHTRKNLWIFTENNEDNISRFISRRSGRVRYNIEFNKIEEEVIEEYCKDMKVSDSFRKELLRRYRTTDLFTFDQLQTIVTEELFNIERYGKSIPLDEVLLMLNVRDVLNKYEFFPAEVKYLNTVLEEDMYRVNITCNTVKAYGDSASIPVTNRDYDKLIGNLNDLKVSIRVNVENEVFHQDDMRNKTISLYSKVSSNMSSGGFGGNGPKFHRERLSCEVRQENIDGVLRKIIYAVSEYFTIKFACRTKEGEIVYL